jgi:hypothetical protein
MTTTTILNGSLTWNDPTAAMPCSPLRAGAARPEAREASRSAAGSPPSALRSLRRAWLGALREEAREVAPFERMALGLAIFSVALALASATLTNLEFVRGWEIFTQWVSAAVL